MRSRWWSRALQLLCAAWLFTGCTAPETPARPNIVLLLADDLGWGDVGFHGSTIETPTLDALAKGGVELSHFYVMSVCSPTRAALMTGRYPLRYGMQQGATHLPLTERTLAQDLHAVGYTTAVVGKWHLGWRHPAYLPTHRGFDHQYGLYTGATDYFGRRFAGTDKPDWFRDDKPLVEKGYATDLIAAEAVRLIREQDPKHPLFLFVSFNAPHTPLSAPARYHDRYPYLAPTPRLYAQVVTCMDDAIASILTALDERGMRDHTLVVFASDNGPSSKAPGSAGRLRGHKHQLYEGGVRVPALLSWPGVLPAGRVYDPPLHAVDLPVTLRGLAGAAPQPGLVLDGVDAWPSIHGGAPPPRRELLYNTDLDRSRASALRYDDWKLILHGRRRAELFNLRRDPYETQDVSREHPEIRRELEARIDAWRRVAVKAVRGGKARLPRIDADLRAHWHAQDADPAR